MKKLLMAIALLSLDARAASEIVDGVTWYYETFSSEGRTCARIIAGNERYAGNLTIPLSLGGNPVTSVGSSAFYGRKGLISVTVPEGVTSIGDYAFSGCRGLRTVTLPSTVESIGDFAFKGCGELTSVTIPAGVTDIAAGAFSDCSGLRSFFVAADNPKYASIDGLLCSKDGKQLVAGVNGDVVVPSDVTSIGNSAFRGCASLTSIQIPVGVLKIGTDAFLGCSGLGSVTIPSCVASLSKTFPSAYQRSIREVVVDDGVKTIGNAAFAECRGLESVVIPSSVESIGESAFRNCEGLSSLSIPAITTRIAANAFCGCSRIMAFSVAPGNPDYKAIDGLLCSQDGKQLVAGVNGNVIVPEKVTRIGDYAFTGRASLMTLVMSPTVTSIGKDAFLECTGLISVTIPPCVTRMSDTFPSAYRTIKIVLFCGEVTNIVESAFLDCHGLESVTIPPTVTNIGSIAFENCSSLPSVTIPERVMSIGARAFLGCGKLAEIAVADRNAVYSSADGILYNKKRTELIQCPAGKEGRVTLPSVTASIGSEAFYFCDKLRAVTLSSAVTNIEGSAFYGCGGLPSISIPKGVAHIGERAFLRCGKMKSIDVAAGNAVYCSQSGILCNKAKTELIQCPAGKTGYVSMPQSVTTIGNYAFSGCGELTSAAIPKGVTNIGVSAFADCRGLTSTTVPDGVTAIEGSVFSGCSGLKFLKLSPNVASIGGSAFSGCSGLTSVTIPAGVTNIGDHAFYDCRGLTSAALPAKVTVVRDYLFSGCSGLRSVRMSADVTRIGGSAFSGCSGLTLVTIPSRVTDIGGYAFSGCIGLTQVTVPTRVKSIGGHAFSGCTGLVSALVPYKVEIIGEYAFSGCSKLKTLTLPPSLQSIGQFAFSGCGALPSALIPSSVTNIGKSAFSDCRGLQSARLPSGLRSVGDSLFQDCAELTSVTLPPNVTNFENRAFSGCTAFTSATVPQGVTGIGPESFSRCSGLEFAVIPTSVTNIGKSAFSSCGSLRTVFVGEGDRDRVCRLLGESGFDIELLAFEEMVLKLTAKPNSTKYGTVSGGGTYGKGQPVQLKASAKSGYVFTGWYTDKDCTKKLKPEGHDNREPEVEYAMPGKKTTVYAKFVSKSSDKKALKFSDATKKLAKSAKSYTAGKTMSLALDFTAKSLPTVTAKSLPKGMTIDSLTGLVSGKPTKPGKYTATVTVKTAAGNTISQKVKIYVKVPSGYYGTFDGYALVKTTPAYMTFTSDKYGAVSGKVTYKGKGYKFTANYSSTSSKKSKFTPSIMIGSSTYKPVTYVEKLADGITVSQANGEQKDKFVFVAQKKPGLVKKDGALAGLIDQTMTVKASKYADANLPKSSDYLTLKFAATDKVKVTGKLKGKPVSFSTTVIYCRAEATEAGDVYTAEAALIEPSSSYRRLATFTLTFGKDGKVSKKVSFGKIR